MAKVPAKDPEWLVKCSWRATAIKIKVRAKDEEEAWEKASKQVLKMLGGQWCLEINVLGTV